MLAILFLILATVFGGPIGFLVALIVLILLARS